ncbi:MAG: ester cyclase [Hyphomicrobiales bacterium]
MSIEANRELVQRLFDEVWNAETPGTIEELYTEDFVSDYRPYGELRHGHQAIRDMVAAARRTFPDYREELVDMVAEEERVAVRLRITGTQLGAWGPIAPTGKRVSYEEMLILQVRDGRVASQRGIADNLSALRQLGVMPVPPGQTGARPG